MADLLPADKVRLEEYKALRQESLSLVTAQGTTVWAGVVAFVLTLGSFISTLGRTEIKPETWQLMGATLAIVLVVQSMAASVIYLGLVWKYVRVGIYIAGRLEAWFAAKELVEPLFWEHWIRSVRARASYYLSLTLLQAPVVCIVGLKLVHLKRTTHAVATSPVLEPANLIFGDSVLGWTVASLIAVDVVVVLAAGLRIPIASNATRSLGLSALVSPRTSAFAGPISIVIPTRNDGRLWQTLVRLEAIRAVWGAALEVIVCGQVEGPPPPGVVYRPVIPADKGACLRTGVRVATHETVIFCDADLPMTWQDFQRMGTAASEGAIVWGNRSLTESGYLFPPPMTRLWASRVFRKLVEHVFEELRGWDPQCGIKAMPRGIALTLTQHVSTSGFGFDVEMALAAVDARVPVVQCPVSWKHWEGSLVKLHRAAPEMLRELLLIRKRRKSGALGK
jgi:hypothetical protein